MIAMLLAVLATQATAQDDSGVTRLAGRCEYPPAVAEYQQEILLALCDSVVIDRGGATATFDFSRGSGASKLRFSGTISGQRMAVSSVQVRSGKAVSATGTCEIFHIDGKPSMVACLARAGSRGYAANFRPSRR